MTEEVSKLLRDRSRRVAVASLTIKFLIVIATALVTYFQVATAGSPTSWTWFKIVGVIATIIVFLCALFLLIIDQDATVALEKARRALEEAQEVNEALDAFYEVEVSLDRSLHLYAALLAMRGAIERLAFRRPIEDTAIANGLLTVAKRSLILSMGFESDHHYTIGIYRAELDTGSNKTALRLLAHDRTIACPIEEARVWPEGVGVAGIALAMKKEVIIPDLTAQQLGSLLELMNGRPQDESLYQSMIAVPVMVGTNGRCWGMVVASSDQPDHFSLDAPNGVSTAEGARALAGMLAMAIAATQPGVGQMAQQNASARSGAADNHSTPV